MLRKMTYLILSLIAFKIRGLCAHPNLTLQVINMNFISGNECEWILHTGLRPPLYSSHKSPWVFTALYLWRPISIWQYSFLSHQQSTEYCTLWVTGTERWVWFFSKAEKDLWWVKPGTIAVIYQIWQMTYVTSMLQFSKRGEQVFWFSGVTGA